MREKGRTVRLQNKMSCKLASHEPRRTALLTLVCLSFLSLSFFLLSYPITYTRKTVYQNEIVKGLSTAAQRCLNIFMLTALCTFTQVTKEILTCVQLFHYCLSTLCQVKASSEPQQSTPVCTCTKYLDGKKGYAQGNLMPDSPIIGLPHTILTALFLYLFTC